MATDDAIAQRDVAAFQGFVNDVEPRLRRAFTLLRGREGGLDATAEALGWAWQNWAAVQAMENPAGYLYRVGTSRTRPRRRAFATPPEPSEVHGFEPGLQPALDGLSTRQRTAVVLVHGCGWTHHEGAQAMGVTRSSVGTHVGRALTQLRRELGVDDHG